MENKQILKSANEVSKNLAEAIQNDYINKGQKVPETIIEIIKLLQTHKKK